MLQSVQLYISFHFTYYNIFVMLNTYIIITFSPSHLPPRQHIQQRNIYAYITLLIATIYIELPYSSTSHATWKLTYYLTYNLTYNSTHYSPYTSHYNSAYNYTSLLTFTSTNNSHINLKLQLPLNLHLNLQLSSYLHLQFKF